MIALQFGVQGKGYVLASCVMLNAKMDHRTGGACEGFRVSPILSWLLQHAMSSNKNPQQELERELRLVMCQSVSLENLYATRSAAPS